MMMRRSYGCFMSYSSVDFPPNNQAIDVAFRNVRDAWLAHQQVRARKGTIRELAASRAHLDAERLAAMLVRKSLNGEA